MSLFKPQRGETRADSPTDSLYEMFRRRLRPGDAGASVDIYGALTHSAVYECVDLISDLVAGFPVKRFRRGADGRGELVSKPLPILEDPSTEIDHLNWRKTLVVGWLLRGYTPGLITSVRKGYPTNIELIHPDRLMVTRARPDAPAQYAVDGKPMKRWPDGRLWIAPGKTMFPADPLGASVLEFARAEIGMGLAARKLGSSFYQDGAIPTAILSHSDKVDRDGSKRVKARFLEALSGTREPVVLGGGWEYKQIQIAPNESQFLESIKANRTIVAGFFKVPPNLIGAPAGTGMTYQNVEHQGIYLLQFTVGPWVQRMETVLTGLTVRPEYVKLDIDELLRTDLPNRYRAHDIGIRAGILSPNEARDIEDRPPIPDGDRYMWPPYRTQLTAAELAGLVDAGPDASEFGLFGGDRGQPVDPNAVDDTEDMDSD